MNNTETITAGFTIAQAPTRVNPAVLPKHFEAYEQADEGFSSSQSFFMAMIYLYFFVGFNSKQSAIKVETFGVYDTTKFKF